MGLFSVPFGDLSPIRMTLIMAGLFGFNGLSIIPAWWHTNSLPLCWISGVCMGVAITMAIWALILHKWRQRLGDRAWLNMGMPPGTQSAKDPRTPDNSCGPG